MWFWKRTVERFWSFDLDKAIEFSVLNELLEKLRRWECAERRWMAEAWFVTVQRKGFIRAGRGEFVLWRQWTLVSWSWKIISELITCWEAWGQHPEAVVLTGAKTAHQVAIRAWQCVFHKARRGHREQMRLSTVWQDWSFSEEKLGAAMGKDCGHIQLTGDARTVDCSQGQ